MKIHLNINGQQAGPFEATKVNEMLSSGEIYPHSLGWVKGMETWEPLSSSVFAQVGVQVSLPGIQTLSNAEQQFNSGHPKVTGVFSMGKSIGDAFAFFKANPLGSIAWPAVSFAISPTGIGAFLIPLTGVNFLACAKRYQMSGKKMELTELFDFSKALEKILGPIILGFIIGLGFLLLIVPGFIFSMWWSFSPCVQADRPELSFLDAMKESRIAAKGNWMNLIMLFFVLGLLQILGTLCMGVGLLVTIPIAHLALYFSYAQCRDASV